MDQIITNMYLSHQTSKFSQKQVLATSEFFNISIIVARNREVQHCEETFLQSEWTISL